MRMRRLGEIATGLSLLLAAVAAAQAQPSFPDRAFRFATSVARAMDECTAPSVATGDPTLPPMGCPQNNTTTSNTLGLERMRIGLKRNGQVYIHGEGFTVGDALRVRMTLRVTRESIQTTTGVRTVTFEDVDVECPRAPDAVLSSLRGSVRERFDLGACLGDPASGLALGNIEIMSASVIDANTGQPVGSPGIVR